MRAVRPRSNPGMVGEAPRRFPPSPRGRLSPLGSRRARATPRNDVRAPPALVPGRRRPSLPARARWPASPVRGCARGNDVPRYSRPARMRSSSGRRCGGRARGPRRSARPAAAAENEASRRGPPARRASSLTRNSLSWAPSAARPLSSNGTRYSSSRADVPDDPAAVAERGTSELLVKTEPLCEIGGFAIGPPRGGGFPGPRLDVSQRDQQLAAGRIISRQRQRQLVEARRLLVRQQRCCVIAGAPGVVDGLLDIPGRRSLGEMKCELRKV